MERERVNVHRWVSDWWRTRRNPRYFSTDRNSSQNVSLISLQRKRRNSVNPSSSKSAPFFKESYSNLLSLLDSRLIPRWRGYYFILPLCIKWHSSQVIFSLVCWWGSCNIFTYEEQSFNTHHTQDCAPPRFPSSTSTTANNSLAHSIYSLTSLAAQYRPTTPPVLLPTSTGKR